MVIPPAPMVLFYFDNSAQPLALPPAFIYACLCSYLSLWLIFLSMYKTHEVKEIETDL